MGYLRCEACGSKALSAASTCPKCSSPFSLHDARGQRVELRKCSGCGIMHRRDRACHWCGEQKPAAWRSPAFMKSATGVAAVALVAVGSWAIREPAQKVLAEAFAPATISAAQPTSPAAQGAIPQVPAALTESATSLVGDSLLVATADGALAPSDSIQWIPAVARTWVNVRADASRGGDVVGVIKPSEKAMLGIGRDGWRQVRSPDISGWVDPKLFESDSLHTRG